MMIPCKNPDKVKFPNLHFNSIWGFQEEALTRRNANDQAGLGDTGLGSFVSKRVSASEFSGVSENVELRTRVIIRRFTSALRELLTRVFGLYQQYAKDGRVYQSTGLNGEEMLRRFSADKLHGRVVLRLAGGPELLDSATERELATGMLQLSLNQLLYNIGIVKPDTIKAAVDRVARAYNAKGTKFHTPDTPPNSPAPNIEHQMLSAGQSIEPAMGENFNEHLQEHLRLLQHPNISTLMPNPVARAQLANHIKATVEMRDQVMFMRAQQAAMAQQMALGMERMGIRPGLEGSSTAQAEPATGAEIEGGAAGGAMQ
jgi:hypothetical protein